MSLRTVLAAKLGCIAILSSTGCHSNSSQPRQATADDMRIASEAIELVESQVASNGEMTRRHGEFVSMEIRSIRRMPPVDFFDRDDPTMLVIQCFARFDKFSTKIQVQVFDGAALNIEMEPSEEFATKENSPLSDCKLVQDGDELWFERTGGDQMRVQSFVTCQIAHPDFEP